jgi:poly(A) polymerase
MSENILKKLSSVVFEGYIVGGILRDYFLKRPCDDLDIILPCITKPKLKAVSRILNATYFMLDEKNLTYRFITKKDKVQIDISIFLGRNLKQDLLRRDFTINALAYPLSGIDREKIKIRKSKPDGRPSISLVSLDRKKIIDESSSLAHIANKKIQITSEKSFASDPLRMIRAFRFAAQFAFDIDKKTLSVIEKNAKKINSVSGERLQEEILKLLSSCNCVKWLKVMDKSGLLTALVSQFESARKCAEIYYGKGGVLKHTFDVVDRVEFLFSNLKKIFPKFYRHLAVWKESLSLLKLAALLHDIAKPKTAKIIGGRLRFFYHEYRGAEMSAEILNNWRFSKNNVRFVSSIIKEHLRIGNLASNPLITDRAIYRFFRDTDPFSIPLLLLCWADYASYISKPEILKILASSREKPFAIASGGLERAGVKKTLRHLQVINLMFKTYFYHKPKVAPAKLIDGNDVMKILKIKPSPKVGEVLEKVRIAQVEGKIKTRQSALKYIKGLRN